MQLKTIEIEGKTYAEVMEGKPVYVSDDGKETPFDAPYTVNTITRLNSEAKQHRTDKETAEKQLSDMTTKFDGISDADAAKAALETVKNLDDKKLVDAGEVEKVRDAAIKAAEAQFAPVIEGLTKERDTLGSTLNREMIGGAFSRSSFVADKLAIPADLAEARFGKNFSLEDGKPMATDDSGNPVFSKERPGEKAGFEEALSILVDSYPQKESILKGTNSDGSGANPKETTSQQNGNVSLKSVGGDRGDRVKALRNKFPDLPVS